MSDPDESPPEAEDVIIFYDDVGNIVKVIPTKDVILIIPDHVLKEMVRKTEEEP